MKKWWGILRGLSSLLSFLIVVGWILPQLSVQKTGQQVPPRGAQHLLFDQKFDVNRASVRDLKVLSGLGEKTAQAIILRRESRGKFKNIRDFSKVRGIGFKKIAAWQNFISF